MKSALFYFFIALCLAFLACLSPAQADNSSLAAELREQLKASVDDRKNLETELRRSLDEMAAQKADLKNLDVLDRALGHLESVVEDRKSALQENQHKVDFLNDFISTLDRKENATKDKTTLLLDMAHHQILSSIESNIDSLTWIFEIQLAIALRDIMEPKEKFGEFVKNFIEASTLTEPKGLQNFIKKRGNYLGIKSEAEPVPAVEPKPEAPVPAAPPEATSSVVLPVSSPNPGAVNSQ